METVSSKLRVGEKIGIGFALIGLLFVGVVWHFHQTLQTVLADHQQLQSVFEARKSLALEIEVEMAGARDAERSFLLRHQESFAVEVDHRLQAMREKVAALAAVDPQSEQTAKAIQEAMTAYHESFRAVAEAWRIMGLDENSGLQGAFRDKIHRLQELAARYHVDRLQTVLLQIRRSEKDLALRQDPAYGERVRKLIGEFRQLTERSELPQPVQQKLLAELASYARSFEPYGESALKFGNVGGGKGSFRDAAHRIEAILDAHYVPDLETSVLELRRREKDFLLRGGEAYPQMVVEIARKIHAQIATSPLAAADKSLLDGLLRDYEQGFRNLVSQHNSIVQLTREMDAAAEQVTPLIKDNIDQANQLMAARVAEIAAASRASIRLDLIVLACAIGLAIVFATAITVRIVRPVRQMAGLLDDLAFGTPTTRVKVFAGGRDEINAMAESVNALIDHRATFLGWWKSSMDELSARLALESASTEEARDEAITDLRATTVARLRQLNAIRSRLMSHARNMVGISRRIRAAGSVEADDSKALEHATQAMETLLEVLPLDDQPLPSSAGNAAG
jgi:methyl-accepting chemotaxis protein